MVEILPKTVMELELTFQIRKFSGTANFLPPGNIEGTTLMTGVNPMRGKQIGISQSHGLLVVPKIDTTMRSQIQRWISQLWMLSNLTDNGIPPSTTLATHIVLQMSNL
uniref:Uncharacterized protein n=1 Tax=Opuntia streptacantha TaxID=393608 RepID=A0A7C9AGE1_OPUST